MAARLGVHLGGRDQQPPLEVAHRRSGPRRGPSTCSASTAHRAFGAPHEVEESGGIVLEPVELPRGTGTTDRRGSRVQRSMDEGLLVEQQLCGCDGVLEDLEHLEDAVGLRM